jgi:TPR repeat protein/SpoVK/Ycf46/Vps4 family AAA+-type ATPase
MTYRSLPVAELKLLAHKPDTEAQFTLGQRYARGLGVLKNDAQAAHWFQCAAESGHNQAQRYLAFAHLNGRGLPKNEAEGVRWLRIAAEGGDAPSQRQLGFHYATGSGTPFDPGEGVHWFRLAAENGDYLAQYNLGLAYANGRGVPFNQALSLHWYQLAAEQGMPEAQCALGLVYEHGFGVPVDYVASAHWNRLAAAKDYAEACSNLGWLYENGLGVPLDLVQAKLMYEAAARQDYAQATLRLAKLKGREPAHSPPGTLFEPVEFFHGTSGPPIGGDHAITQYVEKAFTGLVGLGAVRQEILRQASYLHVQKLRAQQGLGVPNWPSRHLVFLGHPGTGKTTIARIIAGVYHRLGILKSDRVVETDRGGLVAPYIGQTALKTKTLVESALGGILFIDEAYALARGGGQDFGKEAIETLLKMMEDHRDNLVVIVAGYTADMETFIHSNPGLASRFNRYIHFPDYSPAELLQILLNFCEQNSYVLCDSTRAGLLSIFARDIHAQRERFGNARYVRNHFEKIIEAQAQRVYALTGASKSQLQQILPQDVEAGLGEALPAADSVTSNYEKALQRLKCLIGLTRVKTQVQRLFDFAHMQREREKAGRKIATGFSQHLVFTGNPGTGKTIVSRIIADLYYSIGIIPSNRIVEVDRSGLVAGYVGQSALKTREVIQSALGGVLFIDEAYALAQSNSENDFGQEVIDTLLKSMEDHRDELVIIVAGYTAPMNVFINSNPGLRSRFNHYIEFDDYEPKELLDIFETYCQDSDYTLDEQAKAFLLERLAQLFYAQQTTANGRFVRNIYERSIEVQSARVSHQAVGKGNDMNTLTIADVSCAMEELVPT